jgi:hypothetical protein
MPGSEACSFINPVTCFLNGPTCVPSVISIKLDGAERRATLNFDQRTNQAAIPDMEAFLSFFDLDVALIKALKEAEKQTGTLPAAGEAGSAAVGVAAHGPGFTSAWVDEGRTLVATFPDQAFVALYSVGAAGQLSLRLRPHECKGQVFGGHLSLRLSEPGQYTVDLSYASANGSRLSWGPMFEASWVVHACNDYVVQISRPSKVRASCPSPLVLTNSASASEHLDVITPNVGLPLLPHFPSCVCTGSGGGCRWGASSAGHVPRARPRTILERCPGLQLAAAAQGRTRLAA